MAALRLDPSELKNVTGEFKSRYKKIGDKTPDSYSMDHAAGKYTFVNTAQGQEARQAATL